MNDQSRSWRLDRGFGRNSQYFSKITTSSNEVSSKRNRSTISSTLGRFDENVECLTSPITVRNLIEFDSKEKGVPACIQKYRTFYIFLHFYRRRTLYEGW